MKRTLAALSLTFLGVSACNKAENKLASQPKVESSANLQSDDPDTEEFIHAPIIAIEEGGETGLTFPAPAQFEEEPQPPPYNPSLIGEGAAAQEKSDQPPEKWSYPEGSVTLRDQLGMVLGEADFLFIEDVHAFSTNYQFLAHPEVLSIAAANGVETIQLEVLDYGAEAVFGAYFKGDIPLNAAERYFSLYHSEMDNIPFGVNVKVEESIVNLVREAKKQGIRIVAVDNLEGISKAEDYDVEKRFGRLRLDFFMDEFKTMPNLETLSLRELSNEFIRIEEAFFEKYDSEIKKFEEALVAIDNTKTAELMALLEAEDPEKAKAIKSMEGYEDNPSVFMETIFEQLTPETREEYIHKTNDARLSRDPVVAKRIEGGLSKGSKTIVLYGGAHLGRAQGDVDGTIGEERTRTIRIFADSQERRDSGVLEKLASLDFQKYATKRLFDDKVNYSLNIANGAWTDRDGNTQEIALPPNMIAAVDPQAKFFRDQMIRAAQHKLEHK